MSTIELVVTDLDGTLWGGDVVVHADTLAAIRELERREVPLLVATGRRRRGAEAGLAAAGLAPDAVVLGGALGLSLATGKRFHRRAFGVDDARHVLTVFRSHDLEPCVYVDADDHEVVVGPSPATNPAHLSSVGRWLAEADLDAVVEEQAVLSFGAIGQEWARLLPVARDLDDPGAIVNRDHVHGLATLMVAPPGVEKWAGVAAYCTSRGLDTDRVLAIGDGENDVTMLERAHVACVVEDGCEPALAAADHVLPRASGGGWARVLDLI